MTRSLPSDLSDARVDEIISTTDAIMPCVLPADWRMGERLGNGAWFKSRDGLAVMYAIEEVDGELWIHVSFSRKDRDPSWHDTKRVKDLFFGPDRKAVIVLPRESEYYNLHPHCLHLFGCIDRDPLPDFRDSEGRL